ncbi:MAG: hypothetical protein FD167_557 [bacterium]|nr:MAG: hypothetical protein FD167_557 [bacterium]
MLFTSNVPKNQKQRKALVESRCPNCQGATKLYLPKEKDKSPVLLCLNYNECKGIVRLEESKSSSNTSSNSNIASKPSQSSKSNDQSSKLSNTSSANTSNGSSNKQSVTTQKQENVQAPTTPPCKECGKPTVKRTFKDKEGKEKHLWGCSNWKPNNQGCNAKPVYINY